MKILFVGQLSLGQTSRMRMEALAELGHTTVGIDSAQPWRGMGYVPRVLQQRLELGPTIRRFNRELIALAKRERPDLVWAEKQELLAPSTLDALRAGGARLVHFTPDPYFALSWKRTRRADACLARWDVVVNAKSYEEAEYRRRCRRVIAMPLGFAEHVHRPLVPVDPDTRRAFTADVGFVGGWEPRRQDLLDAVARVGCTVKIWGYAWEHLSEERLTPRRVLRMYRLAGGQRFRFGRDPLLQAALQASEVYDDRYAWALTCARIGIGFLRKICPDQHTTRTFEIPACGSLLLADRTDEHRAFFEEGREADFFDSAEELVDKVRYYLANESVRERVARAGLERCHRSGYSYRARLARVLGELA